MPSVNNLAVTMLFNSGRYDHVKLSVSIDAAGCSKPGKLMAELESIVTDLNPYPPNDDEYVKDAAEKLAEYREGDDMGSPGQWGTFAWAKAVVERHEQFLARRQSAYDRLDAIGAPVIES